MIKIAHFQSKRGDSTLIPTWPEAEKLLNENLSKSPDHDIRPTILGVSAYPSALHHNMIIVYEDGKPTA